MSDITLDSPAFYARAKRIFEEWNASPFAFLPPSHGQRSFKTWALTIISLTSILFMPSSLKSVTKPSPSSSFPQRANNDPELESLRNIDHILIFAGDADEELGSTKKSVQLQVSDP